MSPCAFALLRRIVAHTRHGQATYEPVEEEADVAGFLESHHDMMLTTAIDEAKESTYAQCSDSLEKHLEDDWQRAKTKLMTSLNLLVTKDDAAAASAVPEGGGSTFGAPEAIIGGQGGPTTPGLSTVLGQTRRTLDTPAGASPYSAVTAPSPGFGGRGGAAADSGPVPLAFATGDYTERTPPADVASLAAIVAEIVSSSSRPGEVASSDIATRFKEVTEQLARSSRQRPKAAVHCWELVRCMTRQTHLKDGFEHGRRKPSSQRFFAAGAMRYLENKALNYMQNQIQRRGRRVADALAHLSPWLSAARAWILMHKDTPAWSRWYRTEEASVDGMPLWPQVFYCFRTGGFADAERLLRDAGSKISPHILPAFQAVVQTLEWCYDRSKPQPAVPGDAIDELSRWHMECSTSRDEVDPFELEMANILSFSSLKGRVNHTVFATMEDFVWQKLIFALCSRLREAAAAGQADSTGGTYTVDDIADQLIEKGAAHFDPHRNTPFRFPELLLLCGRFEYAIDHLAKTHPADAVHLALALQYYQALATRFVPLDGGVGGSSAFGGVSEGMDDFDGDGRGGAGGREHLPSAAADGIGPPVSRDEEDARRNGFLITYTDPTTRRRAEALDLGTLIKEYADKVLRQHPTLAAEYVCALRDNYAREFLLRQLLLESRGYDVLLGRVDQDTLALQDGHLYQILERKDVNSIALSAAQWAKENGRNADAIAIFLRTDDTSVEGLGLAVHDRSTKLRAILDILCTQLANLLMPSSGAAASVAEREQWEMWAKDVEAIMLPRYDRDHALRDDTLRGLRDTFATLLDLHDFINLVQNGQYHDALDLLYDERRRLGMVPSPDAGELDRAEARFAELEPRVRNRINIVLEATLQCLYNLYLRAKRDRGRDRGHVDELRERARAVIAFHSVLRKYPSVYGADTSQRLAHWEVKFT